MLLRRKTFVFMLLHKVDSCACSSTKERLRASLVQGRTVQKRFRKLLTCLFTTGTLGRPEENKAAPAFHAPQDSKACESSDQPAHKPEEARKPHEQTPPQSPLQVASKMNHRTQSAQAFADRTDREAARKDPAGNPEAAQEKKGLAGLGISSSKSKFTRR